MLTRYRQLLQGIVVGLVLAAVLAGVVFERHFAADYQRKTEQIAAIIGYLNAHPLTAIPARK